MHATINIGRYIRFIDHHSSLARLGVSKFKSWNIQSLPNPKAVSITFTHVSKYFDDITMADQRRMRSFYEATRGLTCIEQGEVADGENQPVLFNLTPVGVPRFPSAADPNDILRCLRDLLTALSGVHAADWVIVDMHQSNVILAYDSDTNTDRYFLIDTCELARKIGDALPAGHAAHPSANWPVSAVRPPMSHPQPAVIGTQRHAT